MSTYKQDNMTIHNQDCMDIMAGYEDGYFDLAVVDCPYGIGMDNQKVRTKPNRKNTYKRKGELQYKSTNWDDSPPDKKYFDELYRVSKNQIIWGANYFCEFIPSGKGWIFWDKEMGDNNFSAGEFAYQSIQVRSAMFSTPSMRVKGTRIHPTQKPIALYNWIYANYAEEGQKILDTHLGSGSNAIAAHYAKMHFVGCELDEDYYKASIERIRKETRQMELF